MESVTAYRSSGGLSDSGLVEEEPGFLHADRYDAHSRWVWLQDGLDLANSRGARCTLSIPMHKEEVAWVDLEGADKALFEPRTSLYRKKVMEAFAT